MPILLDEGWSLDQGLFLDATAVVAPPVVVPRDPAIDLALAARRSDRYTPLVRVGVCWPDGSIRELWDGDDRIITGGSVREDRSRQVRRSCSLELVNERGLLSPSSPGDLWFNGSRFRVWWGVRVASSDVYDLYFDGIVSRFELTGATLRITGDDLTSLCNQSFGEVVEVEAGMTAEEAVAHLWEPVLGPYVDPSTWLLDGGGRSVAYRAWTESDNRLSAAVALMQNLGLDIWAAREGPPVLQATPDPTTADLARIIDQDPTTGDILTLTRTGSGRPFNVSVAVSTLEDGTAFRGVSRVTDRRSPIHEDTIGRQVGEIYRNNQMADQAAVNAVARRRLIENAFVDTVRLSAVPDHTLREDDVVQVNEALSATDDRYRIDSLDLPIAGGPMTVTATKITPLFDDEAG